MNNVVKIDWNINKVYFKDGLAEFVVSKSHKKEIDNYGKNWLYIIVFFNFDFVIFYV